jgi:hypothetical protein
MYTQRNQWVGHVGVARKVLLAQVNGHQQFHHIAVS